VLTFIQTESVLTNANLLADYLDSIVSIYKWQTFGLTNR